MSSAAATYNNNKYLEVGSHRRPLKRSNFFFLSCSERILIHHVSWSWWWAHGFSSWCHYTNIVWKFDCCSCFVMYRELMWYLLFSVNDLVFVDVCQYAAGRKRGHADDSYSSGYVSYPQVYSADYSNAAQTVRCPQSDVFVCFQWISARVCFRIRKWIR